jgi:hypothetical protein
MKSKENDSPNQFSYSKSLLAAADSKTSSVFLTCQRTEFFLALSWRRTASAEYPALSNQHNG